MVPRPKGLTAGQPDDLRRFARQVMGQLEMRRTVFAREALIREQDAAFRAREALRDTQAAIAAADGDLDAILDALVVGAMMWPRRPMAGC